MSNLSTGNNGTITSCKDVKQNTDRITFFADKFGVSKSAVLIAMSLAGGDDLLIEKILRQNRFSR
jgi:hypothetical protein